MASSDEDDSEQIGNKVSSERRKRKTRTFYKSWEDLSNSGKRHRERNMKKKLEQGLEVRAVEEVPINNISNSSRIEVDNASQVNEQQDLVFTSDDTCSEIYSKYPSLSSQFEVPSPCSSSVSSVNTLVASPHQQSWSFPWLNNSESILQQILQEMVAMRDANKVNNKRMLDQLSSLRNEMLSSTGSGSDRGGSSSSNRDYDVSLPNDDPYSSFKPISSVSELEEAEKLFLSKKPDDILKRSKIITKLVPFLSNKLSYTKVGNSLIASLLVVYFEGKFLDKCIGWTKNHGRLSLCDKPGHSYFFFLTINKAFPGTLKLVGEVTAGLPLVLKRMREKAKRQLFSGANKSCSKKLKSSNTKEYQHPSSPNDQTQTKYSSDEDSDVDDS